MCVYTHTIDIKIYNYIMVERENAASLFQTGLNTLKNKKQ